MENGKYRTNRHFSDQCFWYTCFIALVWFFEMETMIIFNIRMYICGSLLSKNCLYIISCEISQCGVRCELSDFWCIMLWIIIKRIEILPVKIKLVSNCLWYLGEIYMVFTRISLLVSSIVNTYKGRGSKDF